MILPVRAVIALPALVALAFALSLGWGFLYIAPIILVLASAVLALAACSLPDWPWTAVSSRTWVPPALLGITALVLSAEGIRTCELYYQKQALANESLARFVHVMTAASWVGFVAIVSLVVSGVLRRAGFSPSSHGPKKGTGSLGKGPAPFFGLRGQFLLGAQLAVLFAAGAVLRVCPILANPDPTIDVYVALRDAPDHLLHGRNPYSASYQSPYDFPPNDYDAYPFYPPLPVLLGLPFRAAELDVRYANVVCDLLAALVLLATGWSRGSPLLGALIAATYLNLPRVPFMFEQSWYEPMLAATLGGGLFLAERGRWLGFVLLGLGLTGKQYGVALLAPVAMAFCRQWRALVLGIVLALAVVLLPFFLWNPHAFLDVVVYKQMARPLNMHALSIRSAVHELLGHRKLSGNLVWTCGAVLIAWVSWRTPQKTTAAALWIGTTLMIFCLCHKQAFFNYYYLCEYLFLLGIAGLSWLTEPIPHETIRAK
jgi:hypothetical protein